MLNKFIEFISDLMLFVLILVTISIGIGIGYMIWKVILTGTI